MKRKRNKATVRNRHYTQANHCLPSRSNNDHAALERALNQKSNGANGRTYLQKNLSQQRNDKRPESTIKRQAICSDQQVIKPRYVDRDIKHKSTTKTIFSHKQRRIIELTFKL